MLNRESRALLAMIRLRQMMMKKKPTTRAKRTPKMEPRMMPSLAFLERTLLETGEDDGDTDDEDVGNEDIEDSGVVEEVGGVGVADGEGLTEESGDVVIEVEGIAEVVVTGMDVVVGVDDEADEAGEVRPPYVQSESSGI